MTDETTPLGDTPPRESNLIPFNQMDAETKHAIQSKGGTVSAQKRRQRAFLLKRVADLVNTPLNPSRPITDINDLLGGKVADINILDIQGITDKTNLTIYDLLLLELIRQSTIGHNYKALTYTIDLVKESENMDATIEQFVNLHPEFNIKDGEQ